MAPPRASEREPTTAVGARLERAAERYLSERGLRTLARNYRCRGGELDLVMQHGDSIVFVEVRYRRSRAYGSAAESVDRRKQQRLLRAAEHYLARHGIEARCACRFDVVALHGPLDTLELDWIEGAFSA